jgi:anaerobic ribonucleoside-triphosphate reductase activating protein
MHYHSFQIVTQEVPGEISVSFNITGCPHRCQGCHSPFLWKKNKGSHLSTKVYTHILLSYRALATCVLFMGGEWEAPNLYKKLKQARELGYKTCLYTGAYQVDRSLYEQLDFIKTGPWEKDKGGLESLQTNQQFIEVSTNKILNHLFQTTHYDKT